ncbi:hypothetical protein AtEden1_Chr1g0069271 [Arabidopsis thaliana]
MGSTWVWRGTVSGGLGNSAQTPTDPLVASFMDRSSSKMKTTGSSVGGTKRKMWSRGVGGVVREQKAKLYIIRRCVVMLLCWHD